MIAQEQSPLAVIGDGRRLRHDVGDRQTVFLPQRHINARHQRKMKGHVTFIAIAEVRTHIGRPLISLCQNESIGVFSVDGRADGLDRAMGLRQILAGCSVAFDQVRNSIHAQRIDSHVEPEAHGLEHLFDHCGIIEVEVRLMRKKTMPVIGFGNFVPCPVRFFRVGKDDARIFVELVRIGPNIHRARRRAYRSKSRRLEPRMLIAGVIDYQLDHDLHIALVGRIEKRPEVIQRPVGWIDIDIVRDVIAIVS